MFETLFTQATAVDLAMQGEDTSAEIQSDGGAEWRERLRGIGFGVPAWLAQVDAHIANALRKEGVQEGEKDDIGAESLETAAKLDEVRKWLSRLEVRLQWAADHHEHGAAFIRRFRVGGVAGLTSVTALFKLSKLVPRLHDLGGTLAPWGITPEFVNEGSELFSQLREERRDATAASADLVQSTEQVEEAAAGLERLLRELRRARNVVEVDAGRPLSGLKYGRLAARARRRGTPVPEDEVAPVPEDEFAPVDAGEFELDDPFGRGAASKPLDA